MRRSVFLPVAALFSACAQDPLVIPREASASVVAGQIGLYPRNAPMVTASVGSVIAVPLYGDLSREGNLTLAAYTVLLTWAPGVIRYDSATTTAAGWSSNWNAGAHDLALSSYSPVALPGSQMMAQLWFTAISPGTNIVRPTLQVVGSEDGRNITANCYTKNLVISVTP